MDAETPLVRAADEISALIREHDLQGFTGLAIDTPHRAVILYWKGSLPEALAPLLAAIEARGTTVAAMTARYSLAELKEYGRQVMAEEPGVCLVAPANDGSGLDIGVLDRSVDLSRILARYPVAGIEETGGVVFL